MLSKFTAALRPWQRAVLSVCAIVVFTWLFHLYTTPEARLWQTDSEALVWGKIVRVESGVENNVELLFLGNYGQDALIPKPGGFPEAFAEGKVPQEEYSVYTSQTGAQGFLFLFLADIFLKTGIDRYHVQRLLWILNTSAFLLCFGIICRWIAEKWGTVSAIFAFSIVFVSHWMTISISNLYWVTWTMVLPMAVTTCWCREKHPEKSRRYLIFLAIAFLFRFMCGFEFVSTVMWCSEVPVFCCFLTGFSDPAKRKKYFRRMFWVGCVALAMFAVAVGIWFIELCVYGGRYFAIEQILETASRRTGAFENMVDLSGMEEVEESLSVSRLSVVGMYLQSQNLWGILGLKEIVLAEMILKAINCLQNPAARKSVKEEAGILLFSAMAPISWFFLASGHAYIHTHIDHLLWLFPFVPLCLAYIAKNIEEIVKNVEAKQKTSIVG